MIKIKILNINKFFYLYGGSETYSFSLKKLLLKNGHDVIDFSMVHENNFKSDYDEYFVDKVDYNKYNNPYNKVKLALKIIYSLESKRKINALVKKYNPDIAHLQIYHHQLSPSILHALNNNNIPIVCTVHDLKYMCPNYKMLNKGKVCEKCKVNKYYNCFINKCVKDSFLKSFVCTVEAYFHRLVKVYDLIDIFFTPSRFMNEKFIEYGFAPNKIIYNPNFLDADNFQPNYNHKNYFIYLGRLTEEKGLFTLINAMKYVNNTAELWLIGSGLLENALIKLINENNLTNTVKLLGYKSGMELSELIKNAMFSIIPSECYENAPYAVLEMMAYGKPTIGSKIGGIPELIDSGESGLIFNRGDSYDLAQKINFLLQNDTFIKSFGQKARRKLEHEFNPNKHYQIIHKTYDELVHKNII